MRMTDKRVCLLAVCACLLFTPAGVFARYGGRVLEDVNRNGVCDDADRGVAGVSVTDGCHVVCTAPDGSFDLPGYARTRFVTVTTPAGYKISRHYLPVCDSLSTYDFLLTADEVSARDDHHFLQITDTEIFNRGVDERWTSYLRDYIAAERPAFLIHTGDICYPSGLRQHIRSVNTSTMGCPVYYTLGNHDLVAGDYGEQLFEQIYGPAWFSFDAGNIHYVVTPMLSGDHAPGFTADEVLRWLGNDLRMMKPGQALVVFNHDCPMPESRFVLGAGAERVALTEYNLQGWIYGHTHYNHRFDADQIPVVCTSAPDKGGIDHSVSAFRRFDMTRQGIGMHRLRYTCVDRMVVVALPAAGVQPVPTSEGKVPFSVNAYYSGAETERVTVTLRERSGGRRSASFDLAPRGVWNWYAELSLRSFRPGSEVEAEITARFSDRTTASSHVRFKAGQGELPLLRLGEPWPTLGGDATHGAVGDASASNFTSGRIAWTNQVGSVFMSSPVISDGRVYVASCNDHDASGSAIYALDGVSGKIVWRYPTRGGVKNSIVCDSGAVVAQDALGNLYVIDALTGRLKWERPLIDRGYPYLSEGLTAAGGVVYAGNGNSLCACRIDTGEVLWQNAGSSGNTASSTTLTLCDGVLVSSGQWSGLYGYDAVTGKLLWMRNDNGLRDRSGSAVGNGSRLYLISGRSLFVLDPATGQTILRRQYDDFSLDAASAPLLTPGEVIFGTASKGLLALDRETLDIRWNLTTGTSLVFTAPYTALPAASVETSAVLRGGVAWFGASDGCLYGVEPVTGRCLWRFASGAPFLSSPAASGNLLVAADLAGNVYGVCIE